MTLAGAGVIVFGINLYQYIIGKMTFERITKQKQHLPKQVLFGADKRT